MKRWSLLLLLVLFAWNIILSYELFFKDIYPIFNYSTDNGSITSAHSEISSDVSELVEKCENKVVTIIAMIDDEDVGIGSGAIYKIDERFVYVVTNHHVINVGNHVRAMFADSTNVEAEIVGSDELSDLAVLKIPKKDKVEAFTVGDSTLVKKGEYVIAMGSPLGVEYQGSVSGGLISGVNRTVAASQNWDMTVLQIDAAINPGNSGGPLINMAGELIGINSMKISDMDVEGFGFAIPINEVIPIVSQLEVQGKVIRPNLGIRAIDISQLSPYERYHYDMENREEGILVTEVTSKGPADQAGIQEGDVILKIDQTKITSMKEFRQILYKKQMGERVTLGIMRGSQSLKVEMKLK
ncbi:MAG: serine protease [Erysipelotrichaceae bacterium]|nr:serine protease [Erysipelotrichaceae bacterium]MCI9524726.1 serine protease [Erysipelotrichaceae bacterium]